MKNRLKLFCTVLAAAFMLTACGGPKLIGVELPETPLVGAYGLMLLSTVTWLAPMLRELRAAAMVRILATNFMASFLVCCVFRFRPAGPFMAEDGVVIPSRPHGEEENPG